MKQIQNIALLVFFFSINFEVWDPLNTSGSFSISKLTGLIYLFVMIPQIMNFVSVKEVYQHVRPVIYFFTLLTIISIFNIKPDYPDFFDFSIFQNIILFWILINHEYRNPGILGKGILSFAIGSIVLALLFYLGIGIEIEGGRVTIFGDNENIVGLRMSISVIILLTAVLQNNLKMSKLRIMLLLPIPIMLNLMALTGSRVALLSFILAFLIGLILFKTKKILPKVLIFFTGLVLFILIWQYLMQFEVLKYRMLSSIREGNLSERNIIWSQIFPLIKSNPIFGIGRTGYAQFAQNTFGQDLSPHNVLIEILALTGAVGLIFYLFFLYGIFKRSLTLYSKKGNLLPLLLLVPVMGMLLSAQILAVKLGWVIFSYNASNTDSVIPDSQTGEKKKVPCEPDSQGPDNEQKQTVKFV